MIFGLCVERFADVEAGLAVGTGVERIVSPEQHGGGRGVAGEVGHRKIAERLDAGVDARMEALGKAGLAPVRRAERVGEARDPPDMVAAGTGAERDRFRSEFRADGEQLFGDLVERLVPADAFPRARSAWALPPHRECQAVRMIDQIERDGSDRAQPAVIERRVPVALDLDQAAVAHMQQDAAAAMAAAAHALEHLLARELRAGLDCDRWTIHGGTGANALTLTKKIDIPPMTGRNDNPHDAGRAAFRTHLSTRRVRPVP